MEKFCYLPDEVVDRHELRLSERDQSPVARRVSDVNKRAKSYTPPGQMNNCGRLSSTEIDISDVEPDYNERTWVVDIISSRVVINLTNFETIH